MADKSKQKNIRRIVTNFIGGLGYLSCMMEWLWLVLLFYKQITSFLEFITPHNEPVKNVVANNPPVGSFYTFIAFAVTALIIMLTVFLLVKIPLTIAKTSKQVVHKAAESAVPFVAKAVHKKPTKKARIKLTAEIIVAIKTLLVILPLVFTLVSQSITSQTFSFKISLTVSLFLAVNSTVIFIAQYLIAKLAKVSIQELW